MEQPRADWPRARGRPRPYTCVAARALKWRFPRRRPGACARADTNGSDSGINRVGSCLYASFSLKVTENLHPMDLLYTRVAPPARRADSST